MSSPGGDDDDLDEVTLWAGRLRAWPTAPQADAEGDETVRSARRAVAADRRKSAEADVDAVADAEAVAGADADAVADETVRSPRQAVAGEPTPASAPEVDAEAVADETVRSPRADSGGYERAGSGPAGRDSAVPIDDDTAPMRSASSRAEVAADVTDPDAGHTDATADDTAAVGPRPRGVAEHPDAGHTDTGDTDTTVDDTAAVGARPRGVTDPVAEQTAPGAAREAHAPNALHRETYAPRRDAPVRVARNPATPAPPVQDAATVGPRRSRGGARLVVLAAAIVGVVALAAVGVALLLG